MGTAVPRSLVLPLLRDSKYNNMLNVTSEIGTLKRVVVHTPGQEIRRMTPALRHELLFDDILYLDLARHEHEAFRRIISLVVPPEDILDSAEMLRDVLEDEDERTCAGQERFHVAGRYRY